MCYDPPGSQRGGKITEACWGWAYTSKYRINDLWHRWDKNLITLITGIALIFYLGILVVASGLAMATAWFQWVFVDSAVVLD
jgi:hypothetical protein